MNEPNCTCVVKNREIDESMRDWLKRWMCMWHWMQTDYYQNKLTKDKQAFWNIDEEQK